MINQQEAMQRNRRGFIVTALLDSVAIMAIGYGIYAKASTDGGPLVADDTTVNVILGAGIALAFWCAYRIVVLLRRRAALTQS